MTPEVGEKAYTGSQSLSRRSTFHRAYTRLLLKSLKCLVSLAPVGTCAKSTISSDAATNGYLPMPPSFIVCDVCPGTTHTQCATYTHASVGWKRAVIVAVLPAATVPERGDSVKGELQVHLNSIGISPSLTTWNVLVPVSRHGQKPKSRLSGTRLEMRGMYALIGTTNEPFSVKNWMVSSYSSRRIGRKLTCGDRTARSAGRARARGRRGRAIAKRVCA